MDPRKKKEGRKILTLGVFLAVINAFILVSALSYTIYRSFAGDNSSLVDISGIDFASPNPPKDSEEQTLYYNSALGFSFEYNSAEYDVSTENGETKVTLRNTPAVTVEAAIATLEKTENDPISNRIALYESQYGGVRKEEQATVEGLPFARISYSIPSISEPSKKLVVNSEIIYAEIDGKYIYATITHSPAYNTVEFLSDLSKSLQTASFTRSPEEIIQKTFIAKELLEINWDAAIWEKSWNPGGISFFNKNAPGLALYILSEDIEDDFNLANLHNNYIEKESSLYTDSKIQLIAEEEILLDDIEFFYSEYSIEEPGELTQKIGIYTGVIEKVHLTIKKIASGDEGFRPMDLIIASLKKTPKDSSDVLGTSNVTQVDKAAIIGRPAVVRILNVSCADIKFSDEFDIAALAGKEYTNLCSSGLGSGFFISSAGHIATNGHVSSPHPLDVLINSYKPSSRFWKEYSEESRKYLIEQGYESLVDSPIGFSSLLSLGLAGFYDDGMIEVESTNTNYVELDRQFDFDLPTNRLINTSDQSEAQLLAGSADSFYRMLYKELTGEGARVTTPDIALLKIAPSSEFIYPGLSLAQPSQIIPGQKVVVIGYPAAAASQTLFSAQSSTIATVTSGSLSAVKQNPTGIFNLIQVDATISQGNSGGPILDSEGNVLGVATYQISQSQVGYNAGVSVEEVLKLASQNQVTLTESTVTNSIEDGLSNFNKGYYSLAVKNFDSAKKSYPLTSGVLDPLIAQANEKISQGEDSSPSNNLLGVENSINEGLGLNLSGNFTIYVLIAVAGLIIALLFIIIARIRSRLKSKDSTPAVIGNPDAAVSSPFMQPTTPSSIPVQESSQTPQNSTISPETQQQLVQSVQDPILTVQQTNTEQLTSLQTEHIAPIPVQENIQDPVNPVAPTIIPTTQPQTPSSQVEITQQTPPNQQTTPQ